MSPPCMMYDCPYIHMYDCMYACMSACTHIHEFICMYVCIHIHVNIDKHISCMHVDMLVYRQTCMNKYYIWVYVQKYMNVCMNVARDAWVHACTVVCKYVYI